MAAKRKKKKKKSIGLKIIKYFFLILLAAVIIIGGVVLGVTIGARNSAPAITEANVIPTTYPSVIYDSTGREIMQLSSQGNRRTEIGWDEIPENLKWAFVDLEDERFYQHNGIDLRGLVRAAYTTLTTSRKEGASTITQQLVKNNVFETKGFERSMGSTVRRKIQEWFLAVELEKQMSKDEILLQYMNTINLSAGNYGVKEAASFFFGKEVKDLTLTECAVIASITQNPSANNPARYPENNWKRATHCLDKMLENGHITQLEYDNALKDNVYGRVIAVANTTAGQVINSYYDDALIKQVMEMLQDRLGYTYAQAYNLVFAGGLSIYSNQDPVLQNIIDTEINDPDNYEGIDISYSFSWRMTVRKSNGDMQGYDQYSIRGYFQELYGSDWDMDFESEAAAMATIDAFKAYIIGPGDEIVSEEDPIFTLQPQASFTVEDYRTGAVLAIAGGRGEKETSMSLNRATGVWRQPGSTFKIVSAFAPALDMGECTLATVFDDEPFEYPGTDKQIRNWWGDSYEGLSTIREGIIYSMNIVACKTLMYIGASNCLPYLESFGYKKISPEDGVMSTAIGGLTNGVSNLENCAAFSAIANDGVYREPMFFSKVVTRDGTVLLDAEQIQDVHAVLDVSTASLLTDAMRDVVRYGTGVLCGIESAPLAGKTGTTNDDRDLWFVGYVPNGLCSCIWIGYDENLSISNNNAQKTFYSRIMDQLVVARGAEGGSFELKGNIVTETLCSKSGRFSNGLCEQDPEGSTMITEYFREDTIPYGRECFVHTKVKICKESGKLANEYCPEDSVEEEVRRLRTDLLDDYYFDNEHDGDTEDTPYAVPTEECDKHDEKSTTTTEETTEEETTEAETEEESEGEEEGGAEEPEGGEGEEGDDE